MPLYFVVRTPHCITTPSKSLKPYVCFFCFNYSKYSRPSGLFKQINQEKKEESGNYSYNVADHASSLALLSFIDIRRTIGISIQMTCSALVFGCSCSTCISFFTIKNSFFFLYRVFQSNAKISYGKGWAWINPVMYLFFFCLECEDIEKCVRLHVPTLRL